MNPSIIDLFTTTLRLSSALELCQCGWPHLITWLQKLLFVFPAKQLGPLAVECVVAIDLLYVELTKTPKWRAHLGGGVD